MLTCFQVPLQAQPVFLWKPLNFGDLANCGQDWTQFWGERGCFFCVSLWLEFWWWQWKRLKYFVLILLWSFGFSFVKELKLNKMSLVFSLQGIAQRRHLSRVLGAAQWAPEVCGWGREAMKKCYTLTTWICYTRGNLETTVSRSNYTSISLPLGCICRKLMEKHLSWPG